MFTPIGLFKEVTCPEISQCLLPSCIFSHISNPGSQASDARPDGLVKAHLLSPSVGNTYHDPRKRRRLGSGKSITQSVTETGTLSTQSPPATASRSISPPPLRYVSNATKTPRNRSVSGSTDVPQAAAASLNPRMITNSPATHALRVQLLKMLYDQLLRLNEEVKAGEDVSKAALELSQDEVVLQALDEEEKVIKNNPWVYTNVIKLRIVKLKKMKFQEWREERLKQLASANLQKPTVHRTSDPEPIDTGLDPEQEAAFLMRLLAKQEGLSKHGYVNKKPTEHEVEQARKGLEAAQGWEQCDRCKSRFQVFPGRRHKDGALTSGGPCTYHPAKPRRPVASERGDKVSRELMYACCKSEVGSSTGCTTAVSHVFKLSNPARLELITPYMETPTDVPLSRKHTAICFDCEMGYTTCGLELIRLTAVSWPSYEEVVDVLVRPEGEILDLNSRFSGVWPENFTEATPYHTPPMSRNGHSKDNEPISEKLQIVDSPSAARELLFSYLSPSTPLIGHAVDNDLNAARIIHPSIIDTVLLYPHPKGLPIRFGLKVLMKKHLGRDIQLGDGANGHDSKEDARAAGELVRLKMQETWSKMKREGWRVKEDKFMAPMSRAEAMKVEISKIKKQ